MVSLLCALWAVISVTCAQTVSYEGYTVHQARSESFEQLQQFMGKAKHLNLDYWHVPHGVNDTLDVMVKPELVKELKDVFNKLGMKSHQILDNVERLFENERRSIHHINKRAVPTIRSYTQNFPTYNEIVNFLHSVASSSAKPRGVSVDLFSMGKSSEGRDMGTVKVYKRCNGVNTNKPAFLIDGGIHAREWIAPAVVINFIYQFVFNPSNDPVINRLLCEFDWYFLPLVNPDGYHHSRVSDRTWRKTMNRNANTFCKGTDANRNFDFHWNPYAGGSTQPCEDIYAGQNAFSIPESRNLAAFMRQHSHNIKAYLTYHSYGQMILYPFGYSSSAVASDKQELDSIARLAERAMNRDYMVGSSGRDLYPAAGGSDDYAKGACGVKYSYTIELPPNDGAGYNGFIIDPSEIQDISADSLKGLKAFGTELSRRLNL